MLVSGNYFSRARRRAAARARLPRGRRRGARPRRRGGARAGLLEARVRERPCRRRPDDPPERHATSPSSASRRSRSRGCRSSRGPTSTCRWRWRGCSRPIRRSDFFEDRDDRELTRARRACRPGTTLRAGARASSPCWRATSSASTRRSIATAARRCAPSSRCARAATTINWKFGVIFTILGAGRAAGGVHQRRGAAAEPRPHAHARDRRAAGAGRRALPADPAAPDREPGARAAWAAWAGSPSATPASSSSQTFSIPDRAAGHHPVPDGHARAAGEPRAVAS